MPSSLPCLSPVCCLSVTRSVSPSVSASLCVCVCVCVCARAHMRLSVCLYLPLAVLESVSELSSLSASVSPDTRRPVRSSGPSLSQVLWLWLTSLRRRAVDCLCVCPCDCLSLVCSLRKVVCLSGGVGERGGGSVGRRGGTEALGRTAPPWLLVGLGTGQVSGRMGAQGPGWAAPRPTGGSEARGPRGSGWRRVRKPDTSGPHGPEQRTGSGEARFAERSRAWRGPGWEGTETSAPLSPPPRPRTHARTHARHAAGGPGSPPGCRTWPGVCWPRGGGVRGRGGIGRPESGRGSFGSGTARAPVERCGRLARPAGQSEREAQRRALRAPGGSRLRLRPYHPERA